MSVKDATISIIGGAVSIFATVFAFYYAIKMVIYLENKGEAKAKADAEPVE